jgi:hypothetical protein
MRRQPAVLNARGADTGRIQATQDDSSFGLKAQKHIRSDFLTAVRASGLIPTTKRNKGLSPSWATLLQTLRGRRAHLGLSSLAHYASAEGIDRKDINDQVIARFINAVRDGSLHQKPNALHRQVTSIWNEAARDPGLGLSPVTVPSFHDGGWAYKVDGAFSEPFPTHAEAFAAA